ncbi:MAG: hypothetical protein LBP64_09165 [Tannerella sp.]|jgi:hypothetical protein|nr:hypothetical protein [Tannerella sp.]
MGRTDYLPSNSLEFQNKVHHIREQVTANQKEWNISAAAIDALDPLIAEFDAAIEVSENPMTRTHAAIQRRNTARAALEHVLRPFIQGQLILNPAVPVDALAGMALPTHNRKPTPVPAPDGEPKIEILTPSPAVIEIKFGGMDGKGHAKPHGVHGMELCWVIAEDRPVDWSELRYSEFATRSPLRLTFRGDERGKWIYFAARWENTRGVKGPWTEIKDAIIP